MSDIFSQYHEWKKSARQSLAYKTARVQSIFAHRLESLLNLRKQSRRQLAEKAGTSPAYITKALAGDTNFTIESMVKLADALNADIYLGVRQREIRMVGTWETLSKPPKPSFPEEEVSNVVAMLNWSKSIPRQANEVHHAAR